jgi:hypothetical protein
MAVSIDRIKSLYNDLLDIQASEKAEVIFRLYGHANNIDFGIYIPNWQPKKEPDYKGDYFLGTIDGEKEFTKSETIVKLLKKAFCDEQVSAAVDNSPKLVHEYTYTRTETGGSNASND